MNEPTYSHFGMIGDLIFSLYFCFEATQAQNETKFNFQIQTNVPFTPSICEQSSRGQKHVFFTKQEAEFIKPLLEAQPYINKVIIDDNVTEDTFNLSNFRRLPLNLAAGDIREWYYQLIANLLQKEFWKQILFVNPNNKFQDKILFTLSERYVNANIDFSQLQKYKDKLVFIGSQKEYDVFCKKYTTLPFAGKFNNLLQIAEVIAGAKAHIANPTGLFAVSECLKVPRMLIGSQFIKINDTLMLGPKNVNPLGGIHTTATNNSTFYNNLDLMIDYLK